jgi:hypothetical protein
MVTLEELENEIRKIKERNRRVETDKAWETSITRKIISSIATYFVIALFLLVAQVPQPWLNAMIPAAAFLLSTLTLPLIKEIWKKNIYR